MIDRDHDKLSITRQCRMLSVHRSTVYYTPRPVSTENLTLMRLIDKQYMRTPSWGSRSMCSYLRRLGHQVNRKRVQRLMRLMNLEAIYPRSRTSRSHLGYKIYPYLLKGMSIDLPNQVWTSDITCIPINRGFIYLVAGPLAWIGTATKCYLLGCQIRLMPCFVSEPLRRLLIDMGRRRSSIPFKTLSSPAMSLLKRSKPIALPSVWMTEDGP